MRKLVIVVAALLVVAIVAAPALAQEEIPRKKIKRLDLRSYKKNGPGSLSRALKAEPKILGVIVEVVTRAEAKKLGLEGVFGLKVTDIKPGSPADKAGLKKGDVLRYFGDAKLVKADDIDRAVAKCGLVAKIRVVRDGWDKAFTIKFPRPRIVRPTPTGDVDKERFIAEIKKSIQFHKNEIRRLRQLVADLKKKPGTDNGDKPEPPDPKPSGQPWLGVNIDLDFEGGVKIAGVLPGTSAAKYGIKEGDILKSANGRKLTGMEDLKAAITKAGAGGKLNLIISREGEDKKIQVILGTRPD